MRKEINLDEIFNGIEKILSEDPIVKKNRSLGKLMERLVETLEQKES